jgi:hypothetical protein
VHEKERSERHDARDLMQFSKQKSIAEFHLVYPCLFGKLLPFGQLYFPYRRKSNSIFLKSIKTYRN